MMIRLLRRFIAAALLVLVLGLTALGLNASYSPAGWLQLMSVGLFATGLLLPGARARRTAILVSLVVMASVVAGRVIATSSGKTTIVTLPTGKTSRWLARVIDEQDVSLVGARVLRILWHLQGRERSALASTLHDAYLEMREGEGVTASPVIDTMVFRQDVGAFDTVVIEPETAPRAGVIFLHGFAGSFTLECWMVAQAARSIDAVTVCPATGFSGWWANADGEQRVSETMTYLHARGVQRIFLAGLSNGGVGAAWLAPKLAGELKGLIIISGAPTSGGSGGLPTLVLQGDHDPNMSAATARAFAARVRATYAELDGGHFVLMMQRTAARAAMASWLREHL
jgi:hypothetical protein